MMMGTGADYRDNATLNKGLSWLNFYDNYSVAQGLDYLDRSNRVYFCLASSIDEVHKNKPIYKK